MANDFASIDIGDRDDNATSETAFLKYMNQLVRVLFVLDDVFDILSQQRIANREQQMLVIDLEDIDTVRVLLRVFYPILTIR